MHLIKHTRKFIVRSWPKGFTDASSPYNNSGIRLAEKSSDTVVVGRDAKGSELYICTPRHRNTSYFTQTNIARCQILIGSLYIFHGTSNTLKTAHASCSIYYYHILFGSIKTARRMRNRIVYHEWKTLYKNWITMYPGRRRCC